LTSQEKQSKEMAKFEEADPRWLVQEREDGTNVNAWHWTESNVTSWGKNRLQELFAELQLYEDSTTSIKTTTIDTFNGEMSINNRKGRLLYFYELDIQIKWEGKIEGKTVQGKVHLPYISEENDDDDFEITVSVEENSQEANRARDIVISKGKSVIKKQIVSFLKEFKEDKGRSILKSNVQSVPKAKESPLKTLEPLSNTTQTEKKTSSKEIGGKIPTKTITMKIPFRANPEEVYETFLDCNRVSAFTQSKAIISDQPSASFSLLDGKITGQNVELEKHRKLVQKWRFSSWQEGHYSTVTLLFEPDKDGAVVHLTQKNVPADDIERTEKGWNEFFFRRMKAFFGWGNPFLDWNM